jgi:hypothetical protein
MRSVYNVRMKKYTGCAIANKWHLLLTNGTVFDSWQKPMLLAKPDSTVLISRYLAYLPKRDRSQIHSY